MTDDQLARILHTALVSTKSESKRDFYGELSQIMATPAFKAILHSIRWLCEHEHLSQKQATEELVNAFRSLDSIWKDYILHEGLENLKHKMSPSAPPESRSNREARL